jgi:hypothetical protein
MHLTRKHSDAECSVHEERTESTILVKFRPSGHSPTEMLMSCESSVDGAKRLADAAALKIGHVCTAACQNWKEIS